MFQRFLYLITLSLGRKKLKQNEVLLSFTRRGQTVQMLRNFHCTVRGLCLLLCKIFPFSLTEHVWFGNQKQPNRKDIYNK